MRWFQVIVALVVALATSVGLRAAARHRHWAGPYGPWASGHAGRFGHGPGRWPCPNAGRRGGPAAPGPGPVAPGPPAPAAPQLQ